MTVKMKRVYESPSPTDGYRVLVDRLWPRGLTEETAHVDLWLRAVAPTSELRAWFGHDPSKWPEFRKRYLAELEGHPDLLDVLRDIERHRKTVTLLFGAKDEEHNQARVIMDALGSKPAGSRI